METPHIANQRWTLDFAVDQMTDRRRLHILAVVDDCIRECWAWRPTPRCRDCDGARGGQHSPPAGSGWDHCQRQRHGAETPSNGRLRDELLNETFPARLPREGLLEAWRWDFNEARPHSKLGRMITLKPRPARSADRPTWARQTLTGRSRPIATHDNQGSNQLTNLTIAESKTGVRSHVRAFGLRLSLSGEVKSRNRPVHNWPRPVQVVR